MGKVKRIVLMMVVVFLVVSFDQVTKSIAQANLRGTPPIIYLNDMARLQYAENTGAFLSLGARLPETAQRWIFVGAVSVVLLALLLYALMELENLHIWLLVGFALILAGGVGNLIDRVLNDGRVVDFMNVGIGRVRTGVFNVADMALMAGVGLVLIVGLLSKEERHREPADSSPTTTP
ncbi:MAG: signal peptidase II [Caldilineaceae bacterium]|jgi:signal peptidase II